MTLIFSMAALEAAIQGNKRLCFMSLDGPGSVSGNVPTPARGEVLS